MAEKKKTVNTGKSKSTKPRSGKSAASEARRRREEALQKSIRRRKIGSVILMAAGVLVTLIAVIPGSMGWNALWKEIHGLFGIASYIIGPLMIIGAVQLSSKKPVSTLSKTLWKNIFAVLILCAAAEIFGTGKVNGDNFGEVVANLWTGGIEFRGGGFFAIVLGVPLLFLGQFGASIIIIITMLVCILLLIDMPLNEIFGAIGKFFGKIRTKASESSQRRREEAALAEDEYRRLEQQKQEEKISGDDMREFREREKQRRKLEEMKQVVNSAGTPLSEPEPEQEKLIDNVTIPPQADNTEMMKEQRQDSRDYHEALKKYMEKRHPIMRPQEPAADRLEDGDADLVPIVDALDRLNAEKTPARVSKIENLPAESITDSDSISRISPSLQKDFQSEEIVSDTDEAELPFDMDDIVPEQTEAPPIPKPPVPPSDAENRQISLAEVYTLPPMNLLNAVQKPVAQSDIESEIRRNADKLVQTLKSFGVSTTYLGASRGPSVTRYELQPAPGVKISKISNLADDIALNLAVSGVRIAPVPDKPAVGIEIPNKVKDTVYFRELVDTAEFKRTFDKKLDTVLGKDISGNTIRCNVSKMPHLLIAGTTGSGKSVCVNSIIMSILMKSTPDDVRLIMVDPKQVEFMMYNGIPHLLIPVVTDPKKAAGALAWAVTEMENRYTLFSENNVRNIDGYNELIDNNHLELKKMPRIVIFIDELADLMMASPKDVEESIVRLAQKARAAGMHLVIATQKPTVQVVTGLIKGNIPSRIALMVASQVDSRVILDAAGAEKLLGNGDMLYMPVGSPKPIRLQGCYVSDNEVERVAEFIKQAFAAEYDEGIMAEIERQAENVSGGKNDVEESLDGDEADDKLEDAIEFVVNAGQASTSALQRHLKLGYGRAARIIDTMEKMGIVGPYEGAKPRQVLMTRQEWNERKLRS